VDEYTDLLWRARNAKIVSVKYPMPIYEYECSLCHSRFERRQRFDEELVSICPKCQGRVRRVFHSVPIIFKGSGFYSTDHGRGRVGFAGREKAEYAAKEPAKNGGEGTASKEPAKKESEGTASKESTESRTEDKK